MSFQPHWMEIVITFHQTAHTTLNPHTEEMSAQNMALGTLIVSVVENAHVQHVISRGSVPKNMRKDFARILGNFVPFLLASSPQSAARLEVFRTQTLVAIEPVDKKEQQANKADDTSYRAIRINDHHKNEHGGRQKKADGPGDLFLRSAHIFGRLVPNRDATDY